MLLHTVLYTQTLYTQKLLHTNTFTHRGFYTQTLLHADAFTHRHFYIQTLLHRRFYTHLLRNILSNYWCGMHRRCKNTSDKPGRSKGKISSENLCDGNHTTRSDAAHSPSNDNGSSDCENRAKKELEDRLVDMPVLGLAGRHFWTLISKKWSRYVTVISRDIRMYCGRFVGPSLTIHGWSPCKNLSVRSFASIQMYHTHAPLPRGILRPRRIRWRWKWKESGNEMTTKMRLQLLNRNTRGGTQTGKGKGKTPTPTHLAQSGQTLKGQGKRKSGRTTGQTQTRGGGADRSAWHNLQGESQNLPRHAKDPNLT